MAFLDYDARGVEAKPDFELLPKGTYRAILVKADTKESKKGTGGYLGTQVQIIEGPFKNRNVYDNLLIWHNDATIRGYHLPRFNSLVLATAGAVQVSDTSELLGKPFLVKIGISKPDKTTGDISNTVQNYYPDSPDFDAYAEPEVPFTQKAQVTVASPAPAPAPAPGVYTPAQYAPQPTSAELQSSQAADYQGAPAVATPPWAPRPPGA